MGERKMVSGLKLSAQQLNRSQGRVQVSLLVSFSLLGARDLLQAARRHTLSCSFPAIAATPGQSAMETAAASRAFFAVNGGSSLKRDCAIQSTSTSGSR